MSFVLIHGAGFGANCWDELIPHLNTQALAVDLPGRGTRVDVGLRAITLADCADAVREDVEAKDLRDVVLVGHSYGGMVITGVANKAGARLAHLVYLDAFLPENGKALKDYAPVPPTRKDSFWPG